MWRRGSNVGDGVGKLIENARGRSITWGISFMKRGGGKKSKGTKRKKDIGRKEGSELKNVRPITLIGDDKDESLSRRS